MTAPAIPTMPCPECAGLGSFYDRPEPCERCGETGRIPRPPLTPEEVAAQGAPGSDLARRGGCLCPRMDNRGRVAGQYVVRLDCPLHEEERG